MKKRLQGKVAIVTGGATGIGEAICKRFAEEGAKVMVVGLEDDPVEDVVKNITESGGVAIGYRGDISMEANAKECVEITVTEFGHLNILINNAGVFPKVSLMQDYPVEAYEYMIRHNVTSAFMMSRYALPELHRTKGNIVSAGSEAGMIGIAQN